MKARCLEALEVAERLADDQLEDRHEHEKAYWDTLEITEKLEDRPGKEDLYNAACLVNLLCEESSEIAGYAYEYLLELTPERGRAARRAWAKQVIHCIWGTLPFRPLPPRRGKRRWEQERKRWLAWHEGTVPKLARSIYDERAFDRLPILADALEEAGCTDEAILDHLRAPGPHARGCWPVDLLLTGDRCGTIPPTPGPNGE